jgi:autotransporter-associated beta strand protein
MKTIPVISVGLCRAWASVAVTSAVLSAVLMGGVSVMAATTNYYWNVGTDFYTNDLDWVSNVAPMGAQNPLAPNGSVNYVANITNGGTINYGDGGGGPSTGYTWTNVLGGLMISPVNNGSGTFNLSSGSLVVSNTGANALVIGGGGSNAVTSFTMSGGSLTTVRDAATFFQDFFIVGNAPWANATFTLSGGAITNMSGIEVGDNGSGTFNVSGGELIDNGWFGVGRGGSAQAANSSGTFNLSGGTMYILRNVGDDTTGADNGVYLGQQGTNASTANISGGTLYCVGIGMGGAGPQSSQFLNISGGTIYMGYRGVSVGNGNHFATISGGTIHTLDMFTNTAADQGDLGQILADGTNWTWASTPAVNLTNSSFQVDGISGPGYVTFAPEANKTITLSNPWFGVGGLVINGPGTIAMGAANTYTGGTTISQGNLTLNTGGSIVDSTLNVPSGSTLTFNVTGTTTFTNVVTGAGNVVLANSGVVNVGSNLQNTGTISQNNGILVVNGSISVPSVLTNSGPATVGPLVAQGTIMTPIGIGTNSSIETGSTVQPGTLTASNIVLNGTWVVKINTAATVGNGVNDLLICSNLTLNPGSSVLSVIAQSAPTIGSYVIGEYTGAVTGAGNFAVVSNGLRNASMSVTIGGGQIVLNVNSLNPANLVWAATNFSPNINWDVNTSSNWTNSATSALDTFRQQDAVTFNAVPGSGVTNRVNVTGQISPSSINVSGGLPYLFAGTGFISGGTGINYSDTNTSGIFTSGNNYTGPVNINAGVLQLGVGGSSWLGTTNGATTINGGTLDLNAQSVGAEPLIIQGTGSPMAGTNNGAINNSSSTSPAQSGGPLNITLAGDTTLNASGNRWDIGRATLGAGGGSFTGNGFNLTKIGNQAIWMHEVGDIGVGNIDIQHGLLGFEFTIGMGVSSDTVAVEPGGTLGLFQLSSNSILNKKMVLNGNATISSGGAAGSSNNFVGPITLNGTNTILTSIFPLNLPGNITGTGGFIVSGTGPLILGGNDTYSGPTLIGPSTVLALEAGGSIPNTPLIYMSPSANTVIDASGAGSMTLGSGQTLEGSGSVKGNFTANAGSSIVLGTNATTYGTILFTNNLTLNGNTNYLKISDSANNGIDNDLLQVNGTLTLSGLSTIIVSPLAALNPGTPYTVMEAGGIIGNAANLKVISVSPRYTMTPVINGNLVQVNIAGNAAPLEWEGYLTPNWDLVTSNWNNLSTATHDHFYNGDDPIFDDTAPITSVVLTNNVIVGGIFMSNMAKTYTFSGGGVITGPLNMYGNGAAGGTTVLAMSNAPALSDVDSQFGNLVYNIQGVTNYNVYTVFGDSSGIAQGRVTFGGSNVVNLLSDNYDNVLGIGFFDGMFWITNGILRYTNEFALGRNSSGEFGGAAVTITNSGTLDINGVPIDNTYTPHISGNGFNGQGALYDSKANAMTSDNPPSGGGGFYNLVLDGDASIGSPLNLQQNIPSGDSPGQINGQGFKLTKLGAGVLSFFQQSDGDTHFGDIDAVAGRLAFQGYEPSGNSIALGNVTNLLSVETNAEVTFFAIWNAADPVHNGLNKLMWLKGGAVLDSSGNSSGNSNNFIGPVFLSGMNLVTAHGDLHFWNSMMDSNGPGGFILGNNAQDASSAGFWLDGTNSYSGPTIISNATVHVGVNSSLGSSSYVQVNSGATLDLSATPVYSFGAGQTVAGNGTVNGPATGNLNFNAGGTLAIGLPTTNGLPNTNTFTLTVSNSVVFSAGSTIDMVANQKTVAVGAVPTDKLTGPTSLTLGGTVTVTNYGGAAYIGGDSLALFSATAIATNSGFNIVPATPGANLAWDISTIPVDGTLRVISTVVVNPNPTNILFSVSGNQLTLSWPADHTGWELEIQTNSVSVGLSNNWVTYPASTTVDSISIPINLANGTVFYRLVYPPQ